MVRPLDLIGVVVFASSSSVLLLELLAGPGRPTRVGRDDGIRVEVQAGLSTDDRVIISYTGLHRGRRARRGRVGRRRRGAGAGEKAEG